jgi:DNA-binding CsgD family transcriptional regulator
VPPVLDFGERLAVRRARSQSPIQDLARELAADADRVAAALWAHVLASDERIADPDDPTVEALAERCVDSTAGAMLSGLAYGVPMDAARPTDASIALLERLAERDDGLAIALRVQRLLSEALWQAWAAFTDERIGDRATHRALLAASTGQLAAYTDCVCEQLTGAWPDARRRRRQGVDVPVAELVSRAVFGGAEAAAAALARLGYPADGFHLALALPAGVGREELENLARRLKLACTVSTLADGSTVWVGFARATAAADLERARPLLELAGPVGMGEAGEGLDGFRRTRQQAADALRVATLSGAAGVTRYQDVALLAVLCADETRARDLARMELGPLAGADEVAVRLRDTVRAYLAAGESQVATAQRLFIHEKTVKYRLTQAEELLGRKIGERRSELAAALMVHRAFGC